MKSQLKPLLVALLLSGFIAKPILAASNASLEASISQLQEEVKSLKKQVKHHRHYNYQTYDGKNNQSQAAHADPINQPIKAAKSKKLVKPPQPSSSNASSTAPAKDTALTMPAVLSTDDDDNEYYLPFDPDVPGQAFVSTGPYLGVRIQYAGTNLIVTSPSVNTDVQLLDIRKKIIEQLNAIMGQARMKPTHSHLLFSGIIESQAGYIDVGGEPSRTDIDLTNVSIDATIFGPNDWLLGFIELTYDNSSPIESIFTSASHYRVGNSRVYVNKAFVTLGNFLCSPFYTSFGQFYVPFGVYSSVMVSDPLTKLVGRTKARSILVGYQQQAINSFYAAAYIFRGDAHVHSVPKIDNGGINVGYRFRLGDHIKANIGGGVISNIADSGGMQLGTNFQDFEQLVHRVQAYNLRAVLSLTESIDIIAEFVGAKRRFNPNDMSFNHHGAKPSAVDIEFSYSFPICEKPSSIGIGYNKSNQALAMGIPLTRSFIVFNTSLFRNTLQSIEFRHDRKYAASDVATGAGHSAIIRQNGKPDNAVTAQFDFYF